MTAGDVFLEKYAGDFDVLFFDVDMPGTDGLDTARRLRRMDSEVSIIFVTNMAQYAICGYEVEALDYLLKPLSYYDFALKFQKALRRITRRSSHTLSVDTRGRSLPPGYGGDLLYRGAGALSCIPPE